MSKVYFMLFNCKVSTLHQLPKTKDFNIMCWTILLFILQKDAGDREWH